MKLLGTMIVGFNMIRFSAFVTYWRKECRYNETVDGLKKAYDSFRKGVLYNILMSLGYP
jgi:hypothetical protein